MPGNFFGTVYISFEMTFLKFPVALYCHSQLFKLSGKCNIEWRCNHCTVIAVTSIKALLLVTILQVGDLNRTSPPNKLNFQRNIFVSNGIKYTAAVIFAIITINLFAS